MNTDIKPDIKTEWDLSGLLSGEDDPKIEQLKEAASKRNAAFVAKWKDRTDYLEDPAVLTEALAEYEKMEEVGIGGGAAWYYFWLRLKLDQDNSALKAKYNKIEDFGIKQGNELSFFMHRISKIPENKQAAFLNYPGLQKYRHLLESSFKSAKYLLSEDEEKLLALMSKPAYSNWVQMTDEFLNKEEAEVLDVDGSRVKKPFSAVASLLSHKDKKVRDSAAAALNTILYKYSDVAEHELNSILQVRKTEDELRKAARADMLTLVSDDVELEVVDALLKSVAQKFNVSAKFYELKAKLLGQPLLGYHERNVEIGTSVDTLTLDKCINVVSTAFKKLDSEFLTIFQTYLKNGQIDVYPKKGKEKGAFCMASLKALPTYVLVNFTGKVDDVTTLAHEMGHAINFDLMRQKQAALNFDVSIATTEVASTFMEDFALAELLGEVSDETRLALNMFKLNEDISAVIRQVACYKFEQDLHAAYREKGYLSKKDIGALFQKNMSAYMGDFVEQSSGSENWWVYWSHIRRYFYVYSYASGVLISKALQHMVKQDHANVAKVKEFLSTGVSASPRDTFLKMGIDIADKSFWDKGLDEISTLLDETWKLAKKLEKI